MVRKIFALGFFDGVHLGHQALLSACRDLAETLGCIPGTVTFEGHPDTLVTGNTPKLINTSADRCRLLEQYGMQEIITIPFDRKLMAMPWQEFIEMLLRRGAAGFVCGEDFRFGHRGEGTAQILAEYCRKKGLACTVVPEQTIRGIRISSTCIRRLLEEGSMEEATEFLGHPHILTGTVVTGRQLGRTMGIPTANVLIPEEVAVPKLGVYACRCCAEGKTYPAVTNIGSRPTVGGHQIRAESWLLDFAGDLYGKTVTLEFYQFLRPETKFSSLEELEKEIRKNGEETRKFFEK